MSYLGWPSLCLRVTDLEASKRFYQEAGLTLLSEIPGTRAILGFGGFRVALMTFLDENLINVRGGDVPAANARLRSAFPALEGEPDFYEAAKYDAEADGCCWTARDPDGNAVFFDSNVDETSREGRARRTREILDGAIEELDAMDAEESILEGLRALREASADPR